MNRQYGNNPAQMTFNELVYGFGSGTMHSSSPASRRTAYMSFSHHNRRPPSRERTQSARARILSDDKKPPEKVPNFDRMHTILLRSHFALLVATMAEEGLIDFSARDRLVAAMSRREWESTRMCAWTRAYAIYMQTRDLYEFVELLLHGI